MSDNHNTILIWFLKMKCIILPTELPSYLYFGLANMKILHAFKCVETNLREGNDPDDWH